MKFEEKIGGWGTRSKMRMRRSRILLSKILNFTREHRSPTSPLWNISPIILSSCYPSSIISISITKPISSNIIVIVIIILLKHPHPHHPLFDCHQRPSSISIPSLINHQSHSNKYFVSAIAIAYRHHASPTKPARWPQASTIPMVVTFTIIYHSYLLSPP